MSNYQVLPIDESFNEKMLAILKASPIRANGLELYFDKSPDIFHIAKLKYLENLHAGLFFQNELNGFASIGYYDALLNGQPERVFTFYHLYLLPKARGRRQTGFMMQEIQPKIIGKANYGIAISMRGNRPVETYVAKTNMEKLPPFRYVDDLVVKSVLLAFPQKNTTQYRVRNAEWEDIPEIVRLLCAEHRQRDFGLVFNNESFQNNLIKRSLDISDYFVATEKNGRIKGVCLPWDCGAFRRSVVLKFGQRFYPTLLAYRFLEKIFPMAPFPKPGEHFRELTITDYAVENRDAAIMHALLKEVYRRNLNRKYHFMNFGTCGSDGLLQAVRGFWHRNIISHIIFTSLDAVNINRPIHLPYIDIAFL